MLTCPDWTLAPSGISPASAKIIGIIVIILVVASLIVKNFVFLITMIYIKNSLPTIQINVDCLALYLKDPQAF